MNALHKKTNKFILDKPAAEVYNNTVNGAPLRGCSRWDKNLRKRGGHRCKRVMSPKGHSYFASGGSILCASLRPDGPCLQGLHSFSPSFARQTVVFLYPFFSSYRKEISAMTMPKRETNSVWSKVREDRDIDDLIFDYEAYHAGDDNSSDR